MPRIRYCSEQTQVAIAPDCGVLDPVVEQSYVNSTYVSRIHILQVYQTQDSSRVLHQPTSEAQSQTIGIVRIS